MAFKWNVENKNRAVRLDPVGKLKQAVGKNWLGWFWGAGGGSGIGKFGGTSGISETGGRRAPEKTFSKKKFQHDPSKFTIFHD